MIVQRINEVRTDVRRADRVQAWSEALEALLDLVRPLLEGDAKFWDAWDSRPVAHVRTPAGALVPWPRPSDCRRAQDLLFDALATRGMLYSSQRLSGPGVEP